jgi:hypothetical protein
MIMYLAHDLNLGMGLATVILATFIRLVFSPLLFSNVLYNITLL